MDIERQTDAAQADAVALVTALQRDDHDGFARVLLTMTEEEKTFAVMSLAASLASCAELLGAEPADLIRRPAPPG